MNVLALDNKYKWTFSARKQAQTHFSSKTFYVKKKHTKKNVLGLKQSIQLIQKDILKLSGCELLVDHSCS